MTIKKPFWILVICFFNNRHFQTKSSIPNLSNLKIKLLIMLIKEMTKIAPLDLSLLLKLLKRETKTRMKMTMLHLKPLMMIIDL